jgi:glycosyltransferase involved in cell wall biosynthesis
MPMNMLCSRGHEIVWCGASTDSMPVSLLRSCDVVHVYRATEASVLRVLEELHESGVAITWDNDDDVRAISKHSPSYARLGGAAGQRDWQRQVMAMEIADVVTTSSYTLAKSFCHAARRVEVIENYLPPEFVAGRRQRHNGFVIGWAALKEHEADAKLLALNVLLRDVLESNPGVRLRTICLKLDLRHERYEHRPRVPFASLIDALREFDVGIAPMADIDFNRARSNVKVKEYAAAGIPWLASPVGEYARLGIRQGGRLVDDGAWGEALSRLIRSRRGRAILSSQGRLWARRETIAVRAHLWEKIFCDAAASAAAGTLRRGRDR